MKRHFISGKFIVGIDPSKEKYDAAVIDQHGLIQGKTFTFQNNHQGFQKQLWNCLNERIINFLKKDTVFAIEAACNLWQKLADFIMVQGFAVVIINPLSTYKARSLINHSFSKTDAKDALVIANIAREGYFDFYRIHSDSTKALHDLAVTYDKLNLEFLEPAPSVGPSHIDQVQSLLVAGFVSRGDVNHVMHEAGRCFSCGRCNSCDNCWIYCPDACISRDKGVYQIDYDYCKGCTLCAAVCPRDVISIIEEEKWNKSS